MKLFPLLITSICWMNLVYIGLSMGLGDNRDVHSRRDSQRFWLQFDTNNKLEMRVGITNPRITSKIKPRSRNFIGIILLPYIICFFAEHGVWPAYPTTMQNNVIEMGQAILSQDDEYIRTYCQGKLKHLTNLKSGIFKGFWKHQMTTEYYEYVPRTTSTALPSSSTVSTSTSTIPQLITSSPTEEVKITISPQPQIKTTSPYPITVTIAPLPDDFTEPDGTAVLNDISTVADEQMVVTKKSTMSRYIPTYSPNYSTAVPTLYVSLNSVMMPDVSSYTDQMNAFTTDNPRNVGDYETVETLKDITEFDVVIVIGNATNDVQNNVSTEEPLEPQVGVNGKVDMPK